MKAHKVYIVGAGPADADLITVRGLQILRQAEVVIYDYLVDRKILDEARPGAQLICCDKLGKKRYSDAFLIHQEKINNLMVRKAREGRKVIRLKNGDPAIFSRLSQELAALVKNKIEFEIVPGVTAASAASCFSGVPLTDRRFASSLTFVTGHEATGKEESALDYLSLAKAGTIVLYMGVENIALIARQLIAAGKPKDTPVVAVERAGQVNQKTISSGLENIAAAKKEKILPPAVFIIGEVAGLEKEFNWLRKSKKVLFTGLSKKRYYLSGTYFHLPLVRIEPLEDYRKFDRRLKQIAGFNWVVFSSRYGVEYFFARLKKLKSDSRLLYGIKIAAIGNSTRERLEDFGISADLVPREESAQGLLAAFRRIDLKDKKIFLPHSNLSDKGLSRGLSKLGAKVSAEAAYRNVLPRGLPDLELGGFDRVDFTSPSGVRNFIKRYKRLPRGVALRCIGEVTRREAHRCHLIN